MAPLTPIAPFDCSTYLQQLLGFPQWMVDWVENNAIHGVRGWLGHFGIYQYTSGKGGWLDGVKDRCKHHNSLTMAESVSDDRNLVDVANRILDWGKMAPHYELCDAAGIRRALAILKDESSLTQSSMQDLCFTTRHRIASHSKIYEMFDPDRWTIYDSRVAIAVACLVDRYRTQKAQVIGPTLLTFPVPKSPRSKMLSSLYPNVFHPIRSRQKDQAALAFIYCSWLLRRISEILRAHHQYGCPPTSRHVTSIAPLGSHWQVYHVEMALWMMGIARF